MKIPATIVTGFLGAGKTSLIRHLLANPDGRRLAVIINEFGDLGVDRELLLGCGVKGCAEDDLFELPNGCICCTVADAFLPMMQKLLDRPEPRMTVDGVIAVIDAPAVAAGRFADDPQAVDAERAADPALAHEQPLRELFEDQLACADMIVLNKTDQLDARLLGEVSAELQDRLRPETKVVLAVRGALDPRVVLGIDGAVEGTIDGRWSHHDEEEGEHGHDEFVSFVAELGPVADPAALERRIRAVAAEHDILRVKGFLHVPGKAMRHVVQCVGSRLERYFDRPWRPDESPRSQLVVIGQRGLDAAAIRLALQR